jgi:hypothetical protein
MTSAARPNPWINPLLSALIATVLVVPIFLLPQFVPSYQGIYASAASDEEHYLAAVREVAEGKVLRRNVYLWEEKEGSIAQIKWVEAPLGFLFWLWPGSVTEFVFLAKWLGIFGGSWLLLLWLGRVRSVLPLSWRVAATTGLFVLPAFLGPDILPRAWSALQGVGSWGEFLGATRFANPVVSGVAWIASFLTLQFLVERQGARSAIWHGIALGLLGWLYPFFWAFSMAATGLWLCWGLGTRAWEQVRWSGLALGIGLACMIPVGWNFLATDATQASTITDRAYAATHAPILEWSVIASLVLFAAVEIAWWRRQQPRPRAPAIASLWLIALAAVVAVNHQVLTGISFQPHHFYFLTNVPIASLLLVFAGGTLAALFLPRKWAMTSGIVACAGLLWLGAGVQIATLRTIQQEYADRQRFAPAFQEVRAQGTPFVVLSDNRISELIPVYTGADVLFAHHAASYPSTSLERRQYAVVLDAWLEGVRTTEDSRTFFQVNRERIGIWLFEGQYYRQRCGSYGCFPDSEIESLVSIFSDFLAKNPEDRFHKYRIDAILWDERTHPEWQLEQYPFLHKTWSGDGVSLWTL